MNDLGELRRENRALRHRFSRLSSTVLRIDSSLDLDTVLREVVDSARALTGAAQGVITTVDAGGGLADFVTSGLPGEEVKALVETSPLWRGIQVGETSFEFGVVIGHAKMQESGHGKLQG